MQNLSRLDEASDEDGDGVHNTMGIIEARPFSRVDDALPPAEWKVAVFLSGEEQHKPTATIMLREVWSKEKVANQMDR